LHLTGSPAGVGKIFIALVAIGSFASDFWLWKLSCFYWNPAEGSRQDPETILSVLIHQLVRTESDEVTLLSLIVDAYNLRKTEGEGCTRLSLPECQDPRQLTDVYEQTKICIDALDEVEPSTGKYLLQVVKVVMEKSKNLVKISATTRTEAGTTRQFEMPPRIDPLPHGNASNIERFIERAQAGIGDRGLLDGAVSGSRKAEIF